MVPREKAVRVIARLDVKGPNLIKGLQLEGHRVLGRPEMFAHHYYEADIDEILLVDNVASLYERSIDLGVISRVAEEIFIPLTVVGGIRSLDDIERAFRAGADRVGINTYAVSNPELISEAAEIFGSQSIVGSVESFRRNDGYEVWTKCGHEVTGLDVIDWCRRLEEVGVGELFVTSVNNDGLGRGFDTALAATSLRPSRCPGSRVRRGGKRRRLYPSKYDRSEWSCRWISLSLPVRGTYGFRNTKFTRIEFTGRRADRYWEYRVY